MWLLDANLDVHLLELLRDLGIDCDSAEQRGWKALRNGDLVAAAVTSGFDVLLTRDQLFAESASRALRSFPTLSIVIIAIPQMPSKQYLERFASIRNTSPIRPVPGKIVVWP
jgi:hypothetical protein